MSAGWKFEKIVGGVLLCSVVLSPAFALADKAAPTQSHKRAKKPAPLPPLPSGPTGPVQPIPLDSMAPVPPQVSYQNSQLTIVAPNSTLADILRAVRKQTGAEIEVPSAPERVVTNLGPGPARDVIAELLNGSRFNYVLLGSAADNAQLTRVVLVAKTGPENISPPSAPAIAEQQQPGVVPSGAPLAPQPDAADAPEAEAAEETIDENADQAAAEAEQPPANGQEQPGVKSPQEMLQEMQQRQLMLQQQQPPGQPPVPGAGMPQRPQEPQ